jgi:hypothetical protein
MDPQEWVTVVNKPRSRERVECRLPLQKISVKIASKFLFARLFLPQFQRADRPRRRGRRYFRVKR